MLVIKMATVDLAISTFHAVLVLAIEAHKSELAVRSELEELNNLIPQLGGAVEQVLKVKTKETDAAAERL